METAPPETFAIATFPAEEAAGLAAQVRACGSVRLEAVARHDQAGELPPPVLSSLLATAGVLAPDLYPLTAVLVSTGMNLNQDFFVGGDADTWAARATPVDKPFNLAHAADDIIGHITAATPFVYGGEDGTAVCPIAEPAADFHIAISAVLYRFLPGCKDRQEEIDRVVAEVDAGRWAVSMECRFTGFDYALVPVERGTANVAKAKLVARTAETAHLTRHLRAFGGTGEYQGYKVARVFRGTAFSAVGLVRTPANPASVIFPPAAAAAVYEPDSDTLKGTSMNDETKAELKAATDLAAANAAEGAAAKAELAAARATIETLKAELTALRTEAETAKAALAAAEAEKKAVARAAKLKDAYGVSAEEAAKAAVPLAALPDEAFDAHLAAFAAIKATALKLAEEKMTSLPAPMSGSVKEVKTVAIASDLLAAPAPAAPAAPALAVASAPAEDVVKAAASELLEYRKNQAGKAPAKSGK